MNGVIYIVRYVESAWMAQRKIMIARNGLNKQNGVQNYDSISGDSSLRGGICIGLLHMLVLRKAIEQTRAQNALDE
jgi:hypothetical protein